MFRTICSSVDKLDKVRQLLHNHSAAYTFNKLLFSNIIPIEYVIISQSVTISLCHNRISRSLNGSPLDRPH